MCAEGGVGAMNTESGQKMQKALRAVCLMHKEVGKLLLEFDNLMPWACESVFGSTVTKDLKHHPGADFWMCEGVYRYLASKEEPGVLDALTVCFVNPSLAEPLLLLGRIEYSIGENAEIADVCDGWDLWYLYFTWNKDWQLGVPKQCQVPAGSHIKSARVIAVPLYSIGSVSAVGEHLARLRAATPAA